MLLEVLCSGGDGRGQRSGTVLPSLSSTWWCSDLAPAPTQIWGPAGLSGPVGGSSLRGCGRRLLREVVMVGVSVTASPDLAPRA